MKNFLDLRPKIDPQYVVVEKEILKPRSWKAEAFRMCVVILIVTVIGWGVSFADDLINSPKKDLIKNFSAMGTVSDIASSTVSIENAKGSDSTEKKSYTFDASNIKTIQTNHYIPLKLSDIQVGDNIIVQGVDKDGDILIRRIISYGTSTATGILTRTKDTPVEATSTVATSTATTTATTTLATSSATTTEATSTGSVIDTIKDAVNNVVDAIIGTSTGTSSTSTPEELKATTTPEDPKATSTPATTTPPASNDQTPNVVEKVADKVADVMNKVVDVITGEKTLDITVVPPTPDPTPTAVVPAPNTSIPSAPTQSPVTLPAN